jgi:predicted patatin/cPLA2 family phospholipase
MTSAKCYRNWPYSYVEGLFWHGGMVNDTVFLSYLDEMLPKREKITRKVTVGTTDAKTGDFIRFTEKVGPHDLAYEAGRASTAIPGFFEPVNYDNRTLIDGGVVINLDIGGAISRCKESGYKDKNIIVDIVLCSGATLPEADPSDFTAAQMLYRYYQISQFQKTMIWISQGLAHFSDVNFRYIVYPKGPLDSSMIPINFDPENMDRLVKLGLQEAKDTVKNGPGFNMNKLTSDWFNSPNNPFNVDYIREGKVGNTQE